MVVQCRGCSVCWCVDGEAGGEGGAGWGGLHVGYRLLQAVRPEMPSESMRLLYAAPEVPPELPCCAAQV